MNLLITFLFLFFISYANAQTSLIPIMTSNSTPSGVASASTEAGYGACGAQLAWNAFDNNNNTGWFNDATTPKTGWLQYSFYTNQLATSYTIFGAGGCNPMTLARSARDWQLICQDNGNILDSRVGITWTLNVSQTFVIASPSSCKNYRLNITNNNGDASYVQIGGFQLFNLAAVKTLACEGDSQTAPRLAVTANLTWCAKLAASLGWNYINFAVGGSKTTDVIGRLTANLPTLNADCFVIQIGANDAYVSTGSVNYPPELTSPLLGDYGITLTQYKINLNTIATMIRNKNIPVSFVTPWPFTDTLNRVQFQFFADAMKDVGRSINVSVIDVRDISQGGIWWNYQNNTSAYFSKFYVDQQHPTAIAHSYEADLFTKQQYSNSCAYH